MRLMRNARQVFGGTDIFRQAEWLLQLIMFVTGCFCASVIVFLRKDCGERYLGWLNLYFGYSVLSTFFFLGPFAMVFFHGPMVMPVLTPVFMLGFIAAAIYQRWAIARKNKAGIEWHSMYAGTSILPVPFSQEKTFKFVEPALVWLVGHFIHSLNWEVGVWLYLSAFALAISNHLLYFVERQAILDLRDGQIEAKYFADAMQGKPAQETAGLVVAESTRKLFGQDAKLREGLSNLPDELKDLLDAAPDVKDAA